MHFILCKWFVGNFLNEFKLIHLDTLKWLQVLYWSLILIPPPRRYKRKINYIYLYFRVYYDFSNDTSNGEFSSHKTFMFNSNIVAVHYLAKVLNPLFSSAIG